ncbi:ESPR-type extended signal peptide-containing protein [Hymenobacter koreensis]|uniref:ESPR-type extended signal peptide-containing protein n=1 Tax=Hymenobacter koreensis TaxID=1084523 RepID=A0ABP8IZS8_9BACT
MLLVLLSSSSAWAQLTGTKTIPGDYTSLSAAITDLNTAGVGAGGVTFNIAAGYTETAANLQITATGTAANPIVFQKTGSGANPLVTAATGSTSTTLDGIIKLVGSDYVTFDGIDLAENAANTAAAAQMEFGYALFKASATDGCQNNVVKNCVVTLNKTNANSIGIFGANSLVTATTALTVTNATGTNSNNKFFGNVVTNAATGIQLTGSSATGFADSGNEIGVTAGNTVGNFGSSSTNWGVGGSNQVGFKISGNTINSTLNYTSATASTPAAASTVTSTLRGINTPSGTSANIDITNNTITLASGATTSLMVGIDNGAGNTAAGNTVNITGNTVTGCTYATATTGAFTGITNSATAATVNLSNNTITNNVMPGTGTMTLIAHTATTPSVVVNINNNVISGNGKTPSGTTAGTSLLCITTGTASTTMTGNTITNNTIVTSGTSTSTGTLVGLNSTASSTVLETLTNNTITGLSISGTSTSTSSVIRGILTSNNGSANVQTLTGNVIGGLSISAGSGTVLGISVPSGGGPNTLIARNKIYDLSASGAGASVTGLLISAGGTYTVANNLIGDLRTPAATGLLSINGVQVAGSTAVNAYFNTIYLNAQSTGATFGTSGLYLNSTTTTLDARNNIVVNKSTAVGTGGYTAALRRSSGTAGTVPANLAATTNNNLYYAGTPSATNLIYVEGTSTATNAQQTIAAYKSFVASRESASVTEDVALLSTNGADATFLHINPATATQVESGGQAISGITTDFDNDTRNATTPDIGADEGTFTPQDLSGPTITYTAIGNTNSTANRTLDVTITDASGVATGANAPRLYFRKGNSGAYAFVNATSVSGNVYTFTFDFAAIGGISSFDVIQYYVAAQDNAGAQTTSSSPVGASGNNPPGTTFSGTPNQFFIQGALSGTYYVGTGTSPVPARTYVTLTEAAAAYNNNNLGGAVTFALLDAAYSATTGETFPVVFNANAGASATNTLTIKPNTGVTASITGSSAASAVIQLNGADYITLDGSAAGTTTRDLTLTSTNTGASAVVWVGSLGDAAGATNITIKNLNVVGGSVSSSTAFGIYAAGTTLSTSGTGADNDNLVIQNNVVSTAYSGIHARGTTAGLLDGLQVTGNEIGGATAATTVTFRGIDVVAATAPQLSRNRVVGMQTTSSINIAAIDLGANVSNAVISRNYISNLRSTSTSGYGAYGINLSSTTALTGTEISNNMISDIITDGDGTSTSFNPFGIRLAGGTGTKVYYNSVNLTGAFTNTTTSDLSAALIVTTNSVTGLDLRNNILVNTLTGGTGTKSYALYATTAASFGTVNHNDYFVSGANGVLAYIVSDRATLADVRTATTQDANSVSVNPQFTSATDLHVTSVVDLNNTATPLAGVTIDYDGETRSATTPDIGSDEFALPQTADLAPVALVSPAVTSACYGPAEPVTVTIRTIGGAALDLAATPATVTVVVTPPSGTAQTFTTTVNTGTLASGATQNVTLPGTLDMTAVGTYSFAITATVQGDVNNANDVLTPAPTRTVVAPVAGTLAVSTGSICVSGTANLTLTGSANGSIQLQQSTDNVTFTDISGATSATFTTPVLTQTTYFRARTSCNTNVATSNVVTVTVNNPQVTGTNTPVAICEGGTATLTATASAGTTLRFFETATGGTALASTATATGATFTTPALTASRQYFVEATSGGSETVGRPAPVGTSNTTAAGYGLVFNANSSFMLDSVDVYPAGAAGTLVVQVQDNTGTLIPGLTTSVAIPAGTGTTAFRIPLKFNIPAGTGLRLMAISSPAMVRESAVGGFPYNSPSGNISITGGYLTNPTSTTYYYFYNWQVSTMCVGTRTPIQVNVSATPTASLPAATATTCSNSPFQLAGTVGGSATGGTYTSSGTGTFSPNATTLNATYTPSAADIAAGSVTLTLTSSGPAVCTAATAQVVLTITAAPLASFSYPSTGTYCAGSANTVTPTLGTGATAGTFSSTTGLTLNATTGVIDLATSVAGTYTVTNTVTAGGCAPVTSTTTVTVAPAASAAFSYAAGTYCVSGTNPTPMVTGTTGGSFSSTTGLSLNATTGAINLSSSTPGTYTVTYTAGTTCPATATATVTVTTAPLAAFSYATGTYCAGATGSVAPAFGTGASAGTFSSTTGLTLNATTGAINLATSTAGTYTVTNTIAASGGCAAATSTATVTISPAAVANAGAAVAFCSGASAQLGTAAVTGATYQWSPATGLSSATAAQPTVTLTNTGTAPTTQTYTLTVTNAGGCSATATVAVTVNPTPVRPTVSVQYTTPGTAVLTSSSATGNQWLLNGAPIAGATAPTYTAQGGTQPGAYTVVVTNATGCASQASLPLTVTATAKPLAGTSLQVYPTPTTDGKATLELSGYRKPAELTVLDATGRVVYRQVLAAGTTRLALDLSAQPTGVYLLRLTTEGGSDTRRLVRQ